MDWQLWLSDFPSALEIFQAQVLADIRPNSAQKISPTENTPTKCPFRAVFLFRIFFCFCPFKVGLCNSLSFLVLLKFGTVLFLIK